LFYRATKKTKQHLDRAWNGDDMCKIPCVVRDHVVGVPQDVDTKIALHNIEERGVVAIGDLLDQGEESYNMDSSVSQGGSNSANYDHVKWEDKETKLKVKGWKYCPVCGTRLLEARLKRNLKTCSKTCTDVILTESISSE